LSARAFMRLPYRPSALPIPPNRISDDGMAPCRHRSARIPLGSISGSAAAQAWRIADGTLVSPGNGADLRSTAVFGDFKLHIEFNCEPGANSGVYLRERYEVQIEDDVEPEGRTSEPGPFTAILLLSWQHRAHRAYGRLTTSRGSDGWGRLYSTAKP
jgi:hypothetical protein